MRELLILFFSLILSSRASNSLNGNAELAKFEADELILIPDPEGGFFVESALSKSASTDETVIDEKLRSSEMESLAIIILWFVFVYAAGMILKVNASI